MAEDIVTDIITRVQAMLGPDALTNDAALKIEAEVRQYWGGDRPYIGKTRADFDPCNARDLLIWNLHHDGERTATLSKRFRLSPRRIRQIVAQQQALIDARHGVKSLS